MFFDSSNAIDCRPALVAGLTLMLVTVANLPGTIALRHGVLVVLLLLALTDFRQACREQRVVVVLLGIFMLYALLHCSLLSLWPQYALSEYTSQLLVALLWFCVGLSLFRRKLPFSIIDIVMLSGLLLGLAEFGMEARERVLTGVWPYMVTFVTVSHLEFTFYINLVLAFVLSVFIFGYRGERRWSRLPRWSVASIALFLVFVSLRVAARNGMIGLVYLALTLLVLYVLFEGGRLGRLRTLALIGLALIVITSLGFYSFRADPRNQKVIESVSIGWNYEHTQGWLWNDRLPLMHNGQPVEMSAYQRTAWIHCGLRLIAARPIGYGYGRGAFSRALESRGIPNPLAHSHSGIIDLGVGLGVPGLLLWLGFCWTLVWFGYRAFAARHDLHGLILMLVSCGFIGRMALESIMRDHMVCLFLFIAAALLSEMKTDTTVSQS